MKQLVAIILSVLYLTASTGATIYEHYCMGKLVATGLSAQTSADKACTNCGMTKKKGCCNDKHTTIKTDKQYDVNVSPVSLIKFVAEAVSSFVTSISDYYIPSFLASPHASGSPPRIQPVPLYITHCVYLI